MLSRLPAELLILVALKLKQKTIFSLILCCRKFHDILLPYLYTSLCLMDNHEGYNHHLSSLVETVMQNPRYLRAVRILDYGLEFGYSDKIKCPGSPAFARPVLSTICDSKEEQKEWYDNLADGNPEAWVVLLLSQLYNLRQLHVSVDYETVYLYKLLRHATSGLNSVCTQPAFSSLSHVTISWHDEDGLGLKLRHTLPFFALPSMRSFTGFYITEGCASRYPSDSDDEQDDFSKQVPLEGSSSVTELRFFDSNGTYGMERAVRSCARLKKFIYEHADGDRDGEGFNPRAFRWALKNSKATLQTLWLDYDEHHYALGYDCEDDFFGSLIRFTALRNVRLRIQQLLGLKGSDGGEPRIDLTDSLPPSIESLWITDCVGTQVSTLLDQLSTVVANRHNRTPHLTELCFQGMFRGFLDPLISSTCPESPESDVSASHVGTSVCQEIKGLRATCEEQGIVFQIRETHGSLETGYFL